MYIDTFLVTNTNDETSPSLLWETLKAYLMGRIISFNASIYKAQMARQTKLSELISEVDKVYATVPTPELFKQ